MKKFILLFILLISCTPNKNENDFVNYDCNIPIIECVLGDDTVNLIVDTGAEYSLIHSEYYKDNDYKFNLIRQIETTFHGIGGSNTLTSDIVTIYTSFGNITFVEQDLKTVVLSMPQYNIVGLIGSDFFNLNDYIIDYKLRKIYPYEQLDSIYGKSNR